MAEYIVSVEKKEDAEEIERICVCDELIRCKDCIHWDNTIPVSTVTPEYYKCLRIPYYSTTANGYCDKAERRKKADG